MIIPVVFSLSPTNDNLIMAWGFHKGMDMALNGGWPIIAQRQYFEDKHGQERYHVLTESCAEMCDYEPYRKANDKKVIQVPFPEDIIKEYIARYPSQTDAMLASQKEEWPEMEQFLVDKVTELEAQTGEKIEAFSTLCVIPFLTSAAKRIGVPVIAYEWGPLRAPNYRKTAYFDLKGCIGNGEMQERYEAFQKISGKVPIFTKREILSLFLVDEQLHYATAPDVVPEYEAGVIGGYNVPHFYTCMNQMTLTELFAKTVDAFGREHVIVRYHPGDPVHAHIDADATDTGSLIDFIRNTKRIVSNASNVAYEAMLYNRSVYELGFSEYKKYANSSLDALEETIASDEFLSFIAFGYLIPFELLKSVSYTRYRLTYPSEEELYMCHLNHYLSVLGIDPSVLQAEPEARLAEILRVRKVAFENLDQIMLADDKPIWFKRDEFSRMQVLLGRKERQNEQLHRQLRHFYKEHDELIEFVKGLQSELAEYERLRNSLWRDREALIEQHQVIIRSVWYRATRWVLSLERFIRRAGKGLRRRIDKLRGRI